VALKSCLGCSNRQLTSWSALQRSHLATGEKLVSTSIQQNDGPQFVPVRYVLCAIKKQKRLEGRLDLGMNNNPYYFVLCFL